jgi:hypothetical protein
MEPVGDFESAPVTGTGPSLEQVFGPLTEALDTALRAEILAAQRRLTSWLLTTTDRPPWSVDGMSLHVLTGGAAYLGMAIVAGSSDAEVVCMITVTDATPTGIDVWNVDLGIQVTCQCEEAHGRGHAVAAHRTEARTPAQAVEQMGDRITLAIDQLPGRRTEEWIALGQNPSTA